MPNYIWRKSVAFEWLRDNGSRLLELTSGAFAIIERPGRKRLLIEAPCRSGAAAEKLMRSLGGQSEKLPRNWLEQFLRPKTAQPLRIGTRLIVSNVGGASVPSHILFIPAGAAFGTGEHATTAMSLRLLERVTRRLTNGWRMLDAGTGSGILALAGKRFGAGEVFAIDNDPMAISTAKRNAHGNGIKGIKFIAGDLTKRIGGKYEIITANLYSELLVSLLPRFRSGLSAQGRLIISGVLCDQEPRLKRALHVNRFQIHESRRRGKWIALLAAPSAS